MNVSNQKIGILLIKIMGLMIMGVCLYFLVHEFAHYITMILCNGVFEDISFGTSSFVAGYINPQFISLVAISSLILPLLITTILFFIKNPYVNIFSLGFTFPSFINAALGLFAIYFIQNASERNTYDMALAYDFSTSPTIISCLTIFGIVYSVFFITIYIKRFIKST